MFTPLLYLLRAEGVPVGSGTWLAFLDAIQRGVIGDLDGLYAVGRAILCRTEADFDGFDLAFAAAFKDAALDPEVRARLEAWLERAKAGEAGERVDPGWSDEELWEELKKRLAEQKERHDGGNHWIGTGGTSPFGHSGRAARGIRLGGPGGGRSAISVATDRQWESYRTDHTLDQRDLQVALRALRRLTREGRYELDLDETIATTARNAGEIDLVERREKENQVHLVLLMDAGGSMAPHARRVEQLFTAASEIKTFRSMTTWMFHNVPYQWLWRDFESRERSPTAEVLAGLTNRHRLLFVGDASMAPYELFSAMGYGDDVRLSGHEWLRRFKERCPASVWLNPDPVNWWDHPTVSAVGSLFPMFELTVDGLRQAVAKLRAPV